MKIDKRIIIPTVLIILISILVGIIIIKKQSKKSTTNQNNEKNYDELTKNIDTDKINIEKYIIYNDGEKAYIKNIILIYFKNDCLDENKAKIINSIDGKVVGGNEFLNMLQIEVKESTYEELQQMCREIEKNDGVSVASIDELSESQVN